jgi:hypothetical protein
MKLFRFCAVLVMALPSLAQVIPVTGVNASAPTSSIVGQLQTPTGGVIVNGTLTFVLSQPTVISGSSSIVPTASSCYTSTQGNVVGLPDPLAAPVLSVNVASGSLPAATYYVKLYYSAAGVTSAVSPEASVTLSSTGTLIVGIPAIQPSSATGFGIGISTVSGEETIQGTSTFASTYQQAVGLVSGAAVPLVNTSTCNIYFSDQMVPTGTYYTVSLTNKNYVWDLSPDGTRIALLQLFGADPPAGERIRVIPLDSQPSQEIVVKGWDSLLSVDWTADGKALFVSGATPGGSSLLHVDMQGNARTLWERKGSMEPWFALAPWAVPSPDGRHLAIYSWSLSANMWMMENF